MSATKSTGERIHDDVRQSRQRVNDALDALQNRLSPGEILDNTLKFLDEDAPAPLSALGRLVRRYPIPAAMAGAGLWWLLNEQLGGGKDREDRRHIKDRFREQLEQAGEATRKATEQTGERAERSARFAGRSLEDAIDELSQASRAELEAARERSAELGREIQARLSEGTDELRHRGRRQAKRLQREVESLARKRPVALGAAGVAVGVLIGALAVSQLSGDDDDDGWSDHD